MATNTKAAAASAPALDAFTTKGGLVLNFTVGVPIPEEATKRGSQPGNKLPFEDIFSAMAPVADTAGPEGVHQFLPNSFWTGERGLPAATIAKTGWVKGKVRDQFNAWKKKDEEARGKYAFFAVLRTGKEGIDGITEPGLSYWVKLAAA